MKEKLDVFKILGEQKSDDQLDVSKILGAAIAEKQKETSKILTEKKRHNQEQNNAPDFDLSRTILPAVKAAPPAPAPAPVKPAPAAKPRARKPAPAADSKRQPVPRPDKPPKSRGIFWAVIKAAVLVITVLFFVTFVLSGMKVTTESMAPMVSKGDRVIVNKVVKSYHRGDVIMFKDHHEQKCIARIVAKDGDFVDIRNKGVLYLNNKPEDREYIIGKTTKTDENIHYPVLVGENEFFVLGDNRENSFDSRNYQIGTIEEEQIIGKVVYCIKKNK